MKIGVTGHRPERLNKRSIELYYWFKDQFRNLREIYGKIELITGMAKGTDQIAAHAALDLGVPVYCYFPYKHKMSMEEEYIIENAAGVRYESDKYVDSCYFDRDRRIVDDCELLLVVWDGIENGGAYDTYKYAQEKGKKIMLYPWGLK